MRDINAYAEDFISGETDLALLKYRMNEMVELIRRYPHKRILEVGCGVSPIPLFMDDYDEYTLVEPADKFMENAKSKLGTNKKFRFVKDFFENTYDTLKDFDYDSIALAGMIFEVENPEALIRTALTLGHGGGTVISATASNARSFHRLLALESGIIDDIYSLSPRNIKLQQHQMLDLDSLYALFEKVASDMGVRVRLLERGSYFVKPFTHDQMDDCLRHGIFDEKVMDGLNRMVKYMPELGSEIYIAVTVE